MNILEIDIGEGFVPIGCLTEFSETEQTETIPTTTRDNSGWRTSRGTFQSKTITLSAYMATDLTVLSYPDIAGIKRSGIVFKWRVEDDDGEGFFSSLSLQQNSGEDLVYNATIRVTGRPSAPPQLPYVDAGVDITLTSGQTTVELDGFVLNPDGSPITYLWTFVSGPITPTITNETTLTPQVDGMTSSGTYVFRLTATNDAGSADDTVSVGEVGVAPGITISPPEPLSVITPNNVEFTITYSNADTVTLASGDITLNISGDVQATAVVSGTGPTTRTVLIDITSGTGSVGITIAPGTASNENGSASGAGPSLVAFVDPVPPPAPSGYNVSFLDEDIQSNDTFIRVDDGNGEAVTGNFFISSSGGGTLNGNDIAITGTPQNIPINVSGLGNGVLTMNFTLVNAGGQQQVSGITTTKSV